MISAVKLLHSFVAQVNVVRPDAVDAAVHDFPRSGVGIRAVEQEGDRPHERAVVDGIPVGCRVANGLSLLKT
jgi:hypothetical protein